MIKLDPDEANILAKYEGGSLKSVATEREVARLRRAAHVTGSMGGSANDSLPSRKETQSDQSSKG